MHYEYYKGIEHHPKRHIAIAAVAIMALLLAAVFSADRLLLTDSGLSDQPSITSVQSSKGTTTTTNSGTDTHANDKQSAKTPKSSTPKTNSASSSSASSQPVASGSTNSSSVPLGATSPIVGGRGGGDSGGGTSPSGGSSECPCQSIGNAADLLLNPVNSTPETLKKTTDEKAPTVQIP